jgi:prepilin-type processing-associated H-X9-DG protein
LGGGDIRRQDMPFVSNRMNFTRIDGHVQFVVPKLRAAQLLVGGSHILTGRNVGQSNTFTLGLVVAGRL